MRKCAYCGTEESKAWYRHESGHLCDDCGDIEVDVINMQENQNKPIVVTREMFNAWTDAVDEVQGVAEEILNVIDPNDLESALKLTKVIATIRRMKRNPPF